MKRIKLFCLPYAGGSSHIYDIWRRYLDKFIDLHPIELAGRGRRYNEAFYNTFGEAVDDVYGLISEYIDDIPYAIFGHSMGSLMAYELCHKIQELERTAPRYVFFSGKEAPDIKREERELHNLPCEEFKEEILKLGGTPEEVFKSKELTDIFIPILRSDYKLIENYIFKEKVGKLDSPFIILNGTEDDVTFNDILGWKAHTKQGCRIYNFKGGHFFIHDHIQNITKLINHTLIELT